MAKLYVGTENGLEIVSEHADGWRLDRTVLDGIEVSAILKRQDAKTLLVATRTAGLFRVNTGSGATEAVGKGVLPPGLRCIAASAQDPDCLYVGCEPSAIYKSNDGGLSWSECPGVKEVARKRAWKYHVDSIPPHIRHILVDRSNPSRIYAAVQIGGVLRSEDGGQTWQDVAADLDPDVHAIAQDPVHPDVLYASTGGGGFVGGPHPPKAPQGYPLYRSDDAGKSWRSVSSGFTRRHSNPIHVYPREPSTIIAAAASDTPFQWGKRPEGADAVLVLSRDGGETWKQVGDGLPQSFPLMVEAIDTDVHDGGRLYIGIGGESTKVMPAEKHEGWVYYADHPEGRWQRLPIRFPVVFAMTVA